MGHLIIGHTSETTARIWVCGDRGNCNCRIKVRRDPDSGEPALVQDVVLSKQRDYTAVVELGKLTPDTSYHVATEFYPRLRKTPASFAEGRFRTFTSATLHDGWNFSFMLSSCNLSVININDLMGGLLAKAGIATAVNALGLETERWRHLRMKWLTRFLRAALSLIIGLLGKVVIWLTNVKQPAPPFLRSPFLKLAAAWDFWVLEVATDDEGALPTAGDVVTASGATGVLACTAAEITCKDPKCTDPLCSDPAHPHGETKKSGRRWRLVVTQVNGRFKEGAPFSKHRLGESDDQNEPAGKVLRSSRGIPRFAAPSFFIHAGDQIYYDIPEQHRKPLTAEYRLAYREAFFYDDANRYLLSHWPSYMILDDHEVADQFARDFSTPSCANADDYFRESMPAYDEYAHSRNPVDVQAQLTEKEKNKGGIGPYWYTFGKGPVRFFVLDTRTERRNGRDGRRRPQIIDDRQLAHLCEWLKANKDALKFVITSVPFVAQIAEHIDDPPPIWSGREQKISSRNRAESAPAPARREGNDSNDKWSAPRFKKQRDQIIEYIAANQVEHLVFLTGDMHCCYHASMRIGTGSSYESTTVHELAAGPANQLQLGYLRQFETRYHGMTDPYANAGGVGTPYEVLLDRFHGEVNAVMHLKVIYRKTTPVLKSDPGLSPVVEWSVIRTLTEDGATAWKAEDERPDNPGRRAGAADGGADEKPDDQGRRAGASDGGARDAGAPISTMSGVISFVRRRKPAELAKW